MKKVFYNGKIYTGELPFAEAFAVEDGRFVFVGNTKDALALAAPGDELKDLQGRFVCAGFNDSHMHILNYGQALLTAKLDEHTGSLADLLAYVKAFAAEHPVAEGAWLKGRGWNQDYFTDVHRMPDRYDLDTISTEYPICLVRCCGHCLVVNSKALEILGITADTPQPEGGSIGTSDCVPDGRFFDNAMGLVYDSLPAPSKEEVKAMIRTACKALNSYGVTSSQSDDYQTFSGLPWQTVMEAYKELEAAGELTVRVYEQSNFGNLESLKAFVEAGHKTGVGSSMFRTGPLKMLGDGSLGARTAYLSRPYADDPSTCGFPVFSQETLDEMIGYANSIGMQVAIHAIGDGCLDMVLDAIEKALKDHPREDHRHGIVHCQISRADQLRRMIGMKLHIYAQSIFLDYDNHIVEARAGKDLASTSYSWKTLMEGGLSVSNGTDCPVEMPDALRGIQCAVTRRSVRDGCGPYLPEQAFTVQEAIDSYTLRGAEASFEEKEKGRIAPGHLADFVVLGEDVFAADPDDIHRIDVLETWLGGVCTFSKSV
ncbi:MAG: amidohydrolase [Lachnospiraceae bacterium]|nr:amidohydrolase [Lachnospiraceae bacterium]